MKNYKLVIFFICLLFSLQAFASDKPSFLKKQFKTDSGYTLNYRVQYPKDYSKDKQYPVILFLHGAGERGSDNERQLSHGSAMFSADANRTNYPAIIIAPQCPENEYWVTYTRPSENQERFFPPSEPITPHLAAVKELLDSYISEGVVDTKQIHITGLSTGGIGTFDLVCRYPDLFVTASPICGGMNPERAANFRGKTKFRISHGDADNVVDVRWSREAAELLKNAGADVIYIEYPGVDHASWENAFSEPDFLSWMFTYSF